MPLELVDFQSHGIREPLTNRISGILDEYPDGTQIARELLQNSDDARSTVQWYLLDHHSYVNSNEQRNTSATALPSGEKQSTLLSKDTKSSKLQLLHTDLEEYMGPALLAGSDSVFEDRDFRSLKNLAASEKRTDESKIGQMGIGFNSIYHLTDCPSFITGDQLMVIEPHERIFNGVKSEFREGAVRGNFVKGNQGLNKFPDQLRTFSVLEDIDFSKPYPGTVFRFPLRTEEQAKTSDISKYAYTPHKVLDMLVKLKDEALKALLFLKHVEKIVIYERKNNQTKPTKLFQIEIVNAEEVRRERLKVLSCLKAHVNPDKSASQEDILDYSVRPTYRITQEDGSTSEETWHISTLIGNVLKSQEYMATRTDGNLKNHKLIPWVGIAAPTDPNIKIDTSRLFCFLPIGIQLPFPVHINGHFAVKQSRREIWTNQDNDFSSQASANIKSLWNVHLFEKQVPEAYAMFLEDVGLDHGSNYDLWPTSCGEGIGLDAIWKELLKGVLKAALSQDRKVFVCGSKAEDACYIGQFSTLYIAGRDLDRYPLLKESLHSMVHMAEGIPNVILKEIAALIPALGLDQVILTPAHVRDILFDSIEQWSSIADSATRVEMIQYCILDNDVAGLEGLPLLPLDGDIWVDFLQSKAQERFFVPRLVFESLSQANAGLVDLNVEGFPFDQVDAVSRDATKFWVPMPSSLIAKRVRWAFEQAYYQNGALPIGCISQSPERFPTDEWVMDFWEMADELPDCNMLLSGLDGVHLLPVGRGQLAPLSTGQRPIHLNRTTLGNVGVVQKACSVLEQHLGCNILRSWFRPPTVLQPFVVEISDAPGVLDQLTKTEADLLVGLSQQDRAHLSEYLAMVLQVTTVLTDDQQLTLRRLPVFKLYSSGKLEPLDVSGTLTSKASTKTAKQWRLARGYDSTGHPWLPPSIDLLADDQPLKNHLGSMIGIPVLTESEYWHLLVANLSKQDEGEWDAILAKLALAYHVHNKAFDLASTLRSTPFVPATISPNLFDNKSNDLPFLSIEPAPVAQEEIPKSLPTRRLTPECIVHPSLAAYFQDTEAVFPGGFYGEAPLFGILSELGMNSTFDKAFVQERIKTLFGSGDLEMEKCRKVVEALYGRLNSECSEAFLSPDLCEVLTTVPWVYTGPEDGWHTPADCRPQSDRALVGNKMPLAEFTFTNEALLDCVGWKSPPPLETVLDNLCSIVGKYTSQDPDQTTTSTLEGAKKQRQKLSALNSVDILPIYQYLTEKVKDPQSLELIKSRLRNLAWVLISGALYTVDRVALKMHCDLQPHFVQVPASDVDDLYLALGVREHIRQEDIEGILASIGSKYSDDERISATDADLVCRLLAGIADGENPTWSENLLVLTEDGTLKSSGDVVYNDMNARQDDLGPGDLVYTFLHRRISYAMAERLKITMFSERCWQDTQDNSFDPFFQEEKIVDRIKGILNDYDPSSIFNEFLQNAADAGATECHFKLDTRSFKDNTILGKKMAAWQGPALLIYNNAEFSEKDFNALCRLGVGSKGEDTSKIGRHGLGFNSVYHFTDVPSVVSGPYIGFFDPHMTNLPPTRGRNGAPIAKGGHRCDFRKLSTDILSDQLEPYKDIFGCDMTSHFKGTLFRLPLRLKDSLALSQSGFTDEGWTLVQIEKMLVEWIEEAKLGMLFMDNMASIHISDGSNPEVIVNKVVAMLPKPSSADGLQLPKLVDNAFRVAPQISTTKITVESPGSNPTLMESTRWLVCTDCTFPFGTTDEVRQLATKRHWSPHCGVAIPLYDKKQADSLEGRLLVHLPTPILTGLPFHIHGGFALTSNRKSLAGGQEKGNERHIWNNFLMERCLPEVALAAFEELLKHMFREPSLGGPRTQDLDQIITDYFQLWPVKSSKGFEIFVERFVDVSKVRRVYPVRGSPSDIPVTAATGSSITMPGQMVIPPSLQRRIYSWLRKGSVQVSEVPIEIGLLAKEAWTKGIPWAYREIDGDTIRKRLRTDPEFIPQQLKTQDEKRWMMEVVLASSVEESLTGLSIIPLRNGEWKGLFSTPIYYSAPADLWDIIDAKDILLDKDLFLSKELTPILKALIASPAFGISNITWGVFVSAFCNENSDGVPESKWTRMWEYLESRDCPATAEELPILKTTYGTMTTLKAARDGLQITGIEPGTLEVVTALMDLLRDLGIVVFDAAKHRNHRYFEDCTPPYSDIRLVSLISQHWTPSASRKLSTKEAMYLRRIILSNPEDIESALAGRLGALPIWRTVGTDSNHLIAAAGALYLEGHFSMHNLGMLPNLISDVNFKHFRAMGATPLKVTEAMMDIVMPRFLNGELEYAGNAKTAYVDLFDNLLHLSTRRGRVAQPAKTILSQGRCYLAQDGSFHTLSELLRPNQRVTQTVFADRPELFPDLDIYQRMVLRGLTSYGFRSLESDSQLIKECAEKVLAETTSPDANPEITRERAVLVVKYIYEVPSAGGVDWMDARWKIVPRETNLEPPYDLYAPNLPLYMSFSSLYRLQNRDLLWTRLGFFPADLAPSAAFATKFPKVGTYYMGETYRHLNTLVRRIAPKWKTTEQQHSLKAHLFKIYKSCEDIASRDDKWREFTKATLPMIMTVPYILNGNDKDPSDPKSWVWPTRLMFDIDQNISSHDVVDPTLHQFRNFLVAAGADQMEHVEGTIDVVDGRKLGDMESQIRNCFETQDQDTGFMDIRFKFQKGSDILAHKVVLARASEFFFRRFTGMWASISTRDPKEPGMQIIDLSSYGDIKTAFWGLMYYFYSDALIQSNGLPLFDCEKDEGSESEGEVSDATFSQGEDGDTGNDDNDAKVQAIKDKLAERVEYLMKLQDVANRFEAARLKDLIAQELVMGKKIMHSNVFNIRSHADQNQAVNVREHCNKFIVKNKSSVLKYVNGEIQAFREALRDLDRQEAQEEDEEEDEDEDEGEGEEGDSNCTRDRSEDSNESSSKTTVEGCRNKTSSADGTDSIDSCEEGSQESSADEEDWEEEEEDWEEASVESTSDKDVHSGTEGDGDDGSEEVDAPAHPKSISPARALIEEELRVLEENREELLALS